MFVLVAYDVSTKDRPGTRRLRRVAKACEDYGQRVQNSVFEVRVDAKRWMLLKNRIVHAIDSEQDSIRFYFLDQDIEVEHYGTKKPHSFDDPLIF